MKKKHKLYYKVKAKDALGNWSTRRFSRVKRAYAVARTLPIGTLVEKHYLKKGGWWVQVSEKMNNIGD